MAISVALYAFSVSYQFRNKTFFSVGIPYRKQHHAVLSFLVWLDTHVESATASQHIISTRNVFAFGYKYFIVEVFDVLRSVPVEVIGRTTTHKVRYILFQFFWRDEHHFSLGLCSKVVYRFASSEKSTECRIAGSSCLYRFDVNTDVSGFGYIYLTYIIILAFIGIRYFQVEAFSAALHFQL